MRAFSFHAVKSVKLYYAHTALNPDLMQIILHLCVKYIDSNNKCFCMLHVIVAMQHCWGGGGHV